jgi:phage protein D
MIPNFRIETNGKDLTEQIRSRLLKLTIKDEAKLKSDCMSLELADDPPIVWPSPGQVFDIALGYDQVLTSVGRFATKHIGVSGNPQRVLKIEAAALEQFASLRNQREESWDSTTLGNIASEIARRNGLKPAIYDELGAISVAHEDQTESDIAFLCRLGRRFDLTVKVSGRFLLISKADRSGAVNGTIPTIQISNPISFEYSGDQSNRYTGVRAFWYDSADGRKKYVLYGKEGVVLEIEFNKITEAGARRAAEAKFREVVRKGKTLTLVVPGNANLAAEVKLQVSGLGEGIDGEWIVKSIEHTVSSSGWTTTIECCVDGYKEAPEGQDDSEGTEENE